MDNGADRVSWLEWKPSGYLDIIQSSIPLYRVVVRSAVQLGREYCVLLSIYAENIIANECKLLNGSGQEAGT